MSSFPIKPNQEISSNNEKYLKTESKSAESAHTPEISEKIPLLDHKTFPDGRILKLYESGHRETIFPNNTRKEEYPNGYSVLFYANKDIKQVFPDGRIVYYYSEQSTSHTSYPDGSKLIRFGTGQTEKHYQDGSKKIKYLDGTIKKKQYNEIKKYSNHLFFLLLMFFFFAGLDEILCLKSLSKIGSNRPGTLCKVR